MRLLLQLFVVFLVCVSSCYSIALPQSIVNANVPGCGEGWFYSMDLGACYYLSSNYTTFKNANTFCEDIGGELVSILAENEYDTVSIYIDMHGLTEPYWIGLKAVPSYPYFKWLDSTPANYSHWINGTAPTNNSYASCYGWSKTLANNGWLQLDCQNPLPYICKRHPTVNTVHNLTYSSGSLSSPNYPLPYYADSYSVYFITPMMDGNVQILLTFQYIGIDAGSVINIYDDGKLLETITNQSPLQTITSKTNKLRVEFNASKEGNERYIGWYATYDTESYDIISLEGDFTSPNYPNNYNNNDDVKKQVYVPKSFLTIFTIWDLQTESGYDCLTIYQNTNPTTMITKISGNHTVPQPIVLCSEYNDNTLHWTSDRNNVFRGFNLTWSVVPGGVCPVYLRQYRTLN